VIAKADELLSPSGIVVLLPPVFALSFAPFFAQPAATSAIAGDDIREILTSTTAEGGGAKEAAEGRRREEKDTMEESFIYSRMCKKTQLMAKESSSAFPLLGRVPNW
jgi:hypothetical protein